MIWKIENVAGTLKFLAKDLDQHDMNKKFLNRMLCVFVVCGVVLISGIVLHKNIEERQFHGDESGWISSGLYYADLLLTRDFTVDQWEGRQCGGWGSRYNLHIGQLLMGIPLRESYRGSGQRFFGFYDFGKSLEENKKEGRIPPDDLLFRARQVSVFFGILCCLVVVLIGCYAGGIWAGITAAIVLINNDLFVLCATRAMTDIYYIFFLLCSCLMILLLAKFSQKRFLVLAGIFCGLATSVKIIGLPILIFMIFTYLIWEMNLRTLTFWQVLLRIGLFLFCSVAVVYLCNPFFWNILSFFRFPMMFFDWDTAFKTVDVATNHGPRGQMTWVFGHDRFWAFHHTLGMFLKCAGFSFSWIFVCGGALWVGFRFMASFLRHERDLWSIPFIFFLSNYLFILIFMKLNWDRYYLSTVIAGQFMLVYFMIQGPLFLWKLFIEKGGSVQWKRLE